jgi:hypothetical protein
MSSPTNAPQATEEQTQPRPMRIEAAVALGKAPPAERLEAFPDELIELEAKRRTKKRERPDETGAAAERATNRSGQ